MSDLVQVTVQLGAKELDNAYMRQLRKMVDSQHVSSSEWSNWHMPWLNWNQFLTKNEKKKHKKTSDGANTLVSSQKVVSRCVRNAKLLERRLQVAIGCGVVDGPQGVHIVELIPGATSDRAGLKKWDVIEALNRDGVRTKLDFKHRLSQFSAGDICKVTIRRPIEGSGQGESRDTLMEMDLTIGVMGVSDQHVMSIRRVMRGVVYESDLSTFTKI